jgi:1-acyl-sn-glycerol-3-phosphate acyltransferase
MKAGPHFSPFLARGFEMVFEPLMRRRLAEVHFLGLPENLPPGRPVIAFANHVSNWDGFLLRGIQKRLRPGWPVYSVMLETELRRYSLFRRLGGIGIRPESPASVGRALRLLKARRAADGDFFLSYFPQGRIWPTFRRPLGFLPGIDLFVKAVAPAVILPLAIHVEPLGKLRPSVFVAAGRPLKVDRPGPMHLLLQDLVQSQLDRIHAFLSEHGEHASARIGSYGSAVR